MHTTSLKLSGNKGNENDRIILAAGNSDWTTLGYDKATADFINKEIKNNVKPVALTYAGGYHFILTDKKDTTTIAYKEKWRRMGSKLVNLLASSKRTSVFAENPSGDEEL